MQVRYYLPNMTDAEAGGLSRFVLGILEGAGDEPRPLGWWLLDVLRHELDRRDAVDDGDETPPEVEFLRLPSWDGSEIGTALIEAIGYSRVPLKPQAAEFVDAVCFAVNVLAKSRLSQAEVSHVR